MTIYVADDNIYLNQGDSGNIKITNLPDDRNYMLFFAISDPETNKIIGEELTYQTEYRPSVEITLSSSLTDKLTIPDGENKGVYQWGLKLCYGDEENTLIPKVKLDGNTPIFQNAPKVFVMPKYVEGNK